MLVHRPIPAARPFPTWLLVAVLSLWLRSFFPVQAIGWAAMDDALFVRLARSIAAGHWLGPFDNLTLVKGPFYPIFIAAAFAAGIPLKLAEHAVYLAASALVAVLIPARAVGTAVFVALAFVPVLWAPELARVAREGLYIGLSLATAAAALSIGTANQRSATWRGAGFGLLAGAFWLTREEGVWLLPALVAILALGAYRTGWRPLLRPVVAAALGCSALIGDTMAYNWSSYRVAETVELRSSAFQHAYGALSRIQHARWQHYVVFPADARALAFRASSAARELQPFFDGPEGEAWRQVGCRTLPGHDCTEILAPWFQWALRDAVRTAGHYDTARDAQRFYRTLAQQIDAACDDHRIPCLPPRNSLMAPFRWSDLAATPGPAWSLLTLTAGLGGTEIGILPSLGTPPDIESIADLVGPVARAPVSVTEIIGRLDAPAGPPSLRVQPIAAAPTTAWTTDLAYAPPTGFTLTTDCPPAACALIVSLGGRDLATVPLASLPPHLQTPDLTLDIGRIRSFMPDGVSWRRSRVGLAIARVIGAAYTVLGPVLLLTGSAGLALTLLRRRDLIRTPLFALVLGSLVAVACSIALLAFVDVTAIPSVNLLYLSPAIPFAIVLGIGGTALPFQRRP